MGNRMLKDCCSYWPSGCKRRGRRDAEVAEFFLVF